MAKVKIKRVNYPSEDFYRFGQSEGAVRVPDDVIEEWINEGVNNVKTQLENGVESPYSYSASGDTMVMVFYSQDCEDDVFDDDNYFEVIIAKNYEEGSFFISDIKQDKYKEDKLKMLQNQIDDLQAQLLEERTRRWNEENVKW